MSATTVDALYQITVTADRKLNLAAGCLAYDATFRADNPRGPGHDPASPQLTAQLKQEYRDAHAASAEAWERYRAAAYPD